MNCRRCNTSEGVRHWTDLDGPDRFCGPCHALMLQMDIIELHHHPLHICNDPSHTVTSDAERTHQSRPIGPKSTQP